MEVRGRRCREISPDRAKVARLVKPTFKKVQIVYYLSKNGHLEHPHFMEVTHLPHQHLRLKDVLDRLTVLRGKGMPSLYSWSCKRSYKSGYVWNDLAQNDIIYPSEGAEYVLKGSELIDTCTEKFENLQFVNSQEVLEVPNFHPKRKLLASKRHPEPEEVDNNPYEDENNDNDEEEEDYEEKISYNTCSNTPNSRCSRGVSTDETESQQHESTTQKNPTTELIIGNSSPPSTTSSTLSDKAVESNTNSKRFEDGDPVATGSAPSRNSVLRQLIACGASSVPFRGKAAPPSTVVTRKSSSLHKGVLCKTAAKVAVEEDEMIKCMSENPRFGNLQAEEKEYFSGSIVESMTEERAQAEPEFKKSSSYNEERSSKAGLGEAVAMEEEVKREKGVKGKCIPIKKKSSKQSKK